MELLHKIHEQSPDTKNLTAFSRLNGMVKTAGIVIIGNEILSGMVQERNAIFSKKIHVKGSESEIAPFLNEIVYHFKEVNVGSYPAKENGRSRVTITLESYLKREVDSALKQLIICLPEKNMIRVE